MKENSKKLLVSIQKIKSGNIELRNDGLTDLFHELENNYYPEAKKRLNLTFKNVNWDEVYQDSYEYFIRNCLADYDEKDNFASYYENILKRKAYAQIAERIGVSTNTLYLLSKMKEVCTLHGIPLSKENLHIIAPLVNTSITKCNTALESDITVSSYEALKECAGDFSYIKQL